MSRPTTPPPGPEGPGPPPPGLAAGGCLVPTLMAGGFLAAVLLLATGRWLGDRWWGDAGGVVGALAGLAVGVLVLLVMVRIVRGVQARRIAAMRDEADGDLE